MRQKLARQFRRFATRPIVAQIMRDGIPKEKDRTPRQSLRSLMLSRLATLGRSKKAHKNGAGELLGTTIFYEPGSPRSVLRQVKKLHREQRRRPGWQPTN